MKRAELKRYLETGWIPKHIAGELLPAESRRTFVLDLKAGRHEQRKVSGYEQVKASDVLMLLGKGGDELLAELFPPKRLHKGECQQTVGNVTTKANRVVFERNWHRLRRYFGTLIASPYEDVIARDLRLFDQLMSLSWRARSFRLCIAAKDLHRITGLDYDNLPKARRRLENWGLLQTQCSGNGGWLYTLLNPQTRHPFAEPAPGEQPIALPDSWALDELTRFE